MSTRTIHFVSLGCPKNRVDSEVMLGVAEREGWTHITDPALAETIVVNTCGFIDPAKKESIDTILEMADHKVAGQCKRLVVAGCLSQRHPDEMARELPEVDYFLGSSDMLRIADVLRGSQERVLVGTPADWLVGAETPRRISSLPGSAYVKIAEGCNRRCSFCVIPHLRGKQRSRPPDDVLREVERLASAGIKEINLISQDTVAYGRDLVPKHDLARLVERAADVPGVAWVRLFYLYPEALDDALIELLANHPRVLPYVDMPLQHASDHMLRRMRRGHGGTRMTRLIERLRRDVPELTFRTAFIVGHPGESKADFEELVRLVRWAEFEHVGVFRYSDEDDSHSATMTHKVAQRTADGRWRRLMEIGRGIARRKNRALLGRRLDVLVEGASDEHEHVLMGRHAGQAPEIDGQVYLSATEVLARLPRPGEIVEAVITQASDYDLVGEVSALGSGPTLLDALGPKGPKGPELPRTHGPVRLRVLPLDNRSVPR